MLARYVVAAYGFFRVRRLALFVISAAVCILCFLAASRLIVREDVRALIPSEPPRFTESFTLLREAPFMRRLQITVGGPGQDAAALADTLADALRSEDIPRVITGPGVSPDPALLAALCDVLPSLLDTGEYPAIKELTTPDAMRASLEADKRLLLTPQGLALRSLVAKDPLGFRNVLFKRLAVSGGNYAGTGSASLQNGHIVDVTGRYALVLAEPAATMTDSALARRVMERVRNAIQQLPEGAEVLVTGAHRHTDANASVIKADLAKIFPVSFCLLALLFLLFIRSARGLFLFLLPVASLAVATAFAGTVMGSVSGIVIGFGSVIIGITADYAIHVYYAVTTVPDTRKALNSVARPLLIGAVTTLASFAALLFSSIAAISQMAVFAMSGIVAALCFALFVLPQSLVPRHAGLGEEVVGAESAGAIQEPDQSAGLCCFRGPVSLSLWGLLMAGMLYSAAFVPVDGDIRKLGYRPENILNDEEKSARIWKAPGEGVLVAVRGEEGEQGLERALQSNDAIWRVLSLHGFAGDMPERMAVSVAPFLPSRKTQDTRHAVWKDLWEQRKESLFAAFAPLAHETGFSATAFLPFTQWLEAEPTYVTMESLASFGLDVLVGNMIARDGEGRWLVYTVLRGVKTLDAELEAVIAATGGEVVSGAHFRDDISEATREDCLRFCLFAFLAISAALLVLFRSFSRWALALFPLVCGVFAVTAVSHLFSLSLTVFHAAALPLIMGLAADYGIFMVLSLERGAVSATKKAVLLSGLTTLAGFGSLVLARHPALYSLGVTVGAGLAVAVFAALWGLPRMASCVKR
ncbi:MAG: hypothetical protein DELT_00705 [Desulfovibrio sp.]